MQSLLLKLPRRKLEPGLALWSFYVRSTVVMQKLRTCNCCIRCLFRTLESLSHRQNIFGSSFFWALFCRIIWFDLFITFYWKISSLTRKKNGSAPWISYSNTSHDILIIFPRIYIMKKSLLTVSFLFFAYTG